MVQSLLQIVGPVAGGLIAGLLHTCLSPDHLATIITLSACQGTKAFWFGIQWGLGHLGGMVIIGTVFTILRAGTDFEKYEHYMDYAVGVTLTCVGIHFLSRAESYFDKEWSPKQATCSCHSHLVPPKGENSALMEGGHGDGHGHGHGHGYSSHGEHPAHGPSRDSKRAWGAVLVGFLQGLACPAGIVGIVFLKAYDPPEIAAFICIFFVTATMAMGSLAMAYGVLTQRLVSSAALARMIYYGSCSCSIVLGLTWIYLNATGQLEAFLGHHHEHGGHLGHDHEHGHEHVHHHNMMLGVFSAELRS